MVSRSTYLTPDGLHELEAEIEQLRSVRRLEAAERSQQAEEVGELDTAGYEGAKNDGGFGGGRAQGRLDSGQGELSDAAPALDWMQAHNPNAPRCWIGGYSFGAWISMQLMMRRPEISGFISVSPPASYQDFSFLAPCPASGMIVHGDKDEVVPIAAVEKLTQKVSSQKNITIDYRVIEGGDHFYADHMDILNGHIDDYLDKVLAQAA